MDLAKLKKKVKEVVPDRFRYARILAVLALQEEIGELTEEVLKFNDSGTVPEKLGDEIGDVIFSCFEIAIAYGFEMEEDHNAVNVNPYSLPEIMLLIARSACLTAQYSLEVEGFGREEVTFQIQRSLAMVFTGLTELCSIVAVEAEAVFEKKLAKLSGKIASGEWDRIYGNILTEKRNKLD